MTTSEETLAAIRQVGDDIGIYTLGNILDYIVRDWLKLKRAALTSAVVPQPDYLNDLDTRAFDE